MFDYSRHAARLAAIDERQDELLANLEELYRQVERTLRNARDCLCDSHQFVARSEAAQRTADANRYGPLAPGGATP